MRLYCTPYFQKITNKNFFINHKVPIHFFGTELFDLMILNGYDNTLALKKSCKKYIIYGM